MKNVTIKIGKDPSGVTYGYDIFVNDELYMTGDDYASEEVLRNDLREMVDIIDQALKSEG